MSIKKYLQVSEIIDWQHPTILELAKKIASSHQTPEAIAKACFKWVMNPVTCKASDVLKHKTGFCYAKSHLLALKIFFVNLCQLLWKHYNFPPPGTIC
ncbi:transglutaminase-like domain-containing protein [Fischerella thermalis]|uniref:transglutaminase-like domain-containing protein n=1 Tax=Fischerella thermalis TaxID=372787 RepID=UPI002155D4A7|nr:transglutaminase family protein [Fischerella thermalis]